MLQGLRVPAVTIEAGPARVAEPAHRDASYAGVMNALLWNGNAPGRRPIDVASIVDVHQHPTELHRELQYPIVDLPPPGGVIDLKVDAGNPDISGWGLGC